jgi:hypothetical protein
VSYLTVSEAARALEEEHGQPINPRWISESLYRRELRDDLCPIQSGRRLIPADYLPLVAAALRRRGLLRPEAAHA